MAYLNRNKETPTLKEAKEKIWHYCAYQERSHQEVRDKLYSLGLRTDEVEQLIAELITEGYLNEERFAKVFAGSKFRIKSWGRNKIVHALEGKGVSPGCIRIALKEIEEEDYLLTLRDILEKKIAQSDETDTFIKRDKISRYAIQRGFEPDLVWGMLKELMPF